MIIKGMAIAIAALIALAGYQWVRVGTLKASVTTIESARDGFKSALETSKTERATIAKTAREWEELFNTQSERWKAERLELDRIAQESAAAADRARRAAAESDRTLHTWLDRYASALREPDCSGLLATRLDACPSLLNQEASGHETRP